MGGEGERVTVRRGKNSEYDWLGRARDRAKRARERETERGRFPSKTKCLDIDREGRQRNSGKRERQGEGEEIITRRGQLRRIDTPTLVTCDSKEQPVEFGFSYCKYLVAVL